MHPGSFSKVQSGLASSFCNHQQLSKGRIVPLGWKPRELSAWSSATWEHFAVDNDFITRFLARCMHRNEYYEPTGASRYVKINRSSQSIC